MRKFVFLVVLFSMISPALAWNDAGHMVIAMLAYRKLSPEDRTKVDSILKEHPHYKQYLTATIPDGTTREEWAFVKASTWPDWVRPSGRGTEFYKDPSITKYHKSPWHYNNRQYFPKGATTQPTTQAGIERTVEASTEYPKLLKDLASKETAPLERAVALAWVEHLVGDIHQPLHAVSLVSSDYPLGDRGGNLQMVMTEGGATNLHSLWDGLAGSPSNFKMIAMIVEELTLNPRYDVAKMPEYAKDATFDSWADESFDWAVSMVYLEGRLKTVKSPEREGKELVEAEIPKLPAMYLINARKVAELRWALAGARLADVIREAVN